MQGGEMRDDGEVDFPAKFRKIMKHGHDTTVIPATEFLKDEARKQLSLGELFRTTTMRIGRKRFLGNLKSDLEHPPWRLAAPCHAQVYARATRRKSVQTQSSLQSIVGAVLDAPV